MRISARSTGSASPSFRCIVVASITSITVLAPATAVAVRSRSPMIEAISPNSSPCFRVASTSPSRDLISTEPVWMRYSSSLLSLVSKITSPCLKGLRTIFMTSFIVISRRCDASDSCAHCFGNLMSM